MSDTNERSVASDGSVASKPVAWAVGGPDGPHVFWSREDASKYMRETLSDNLMCLYNHNHLRLSDEERDAVEAALGWCDGCDTKTIATLRAMLERTK